MVTTQACSNNLNHSQVHDDVQALQVVGLIFISIKGRGYHLLLRRIEFKVLY